MSSSALPPLSMPVTGQISDCTSSHSQPLDCTPSPRSSLELHHTSLPQQSHTNNITPPMETIKYTQEFPFLSLPPEIRNMIYHDIFTPVKDGTSWVVYADWAVTRLRGFRRSCFLCEATLIHTTCRPRYARVTGMIQAFEFSGNFVCSGILQTCKTIREEASLISLACMHVSIVYSNGSLGHLTRALQLLLAYMRQPKGAYLSVLTCICLETRPDDGCDMRDFSRLVNELGIKIGYLVLNELMSKVYPNIGRSFVSASDGLHSKPARIEWVPYARTGAPSDPHHSQMIEFNEAAKKWLAELARVKASDPTVRLPLLRDSLPHFFEESAG